MKHEYWAIIVNNNKILAHPKYVNMPHRYSGPVYHWLWLLNTLMQPQIIQGPQVASRFDGSLH